MADTPKLESLGKYRIESVLGRGAMGVVYRALDPVIDRVVALKVMHTHLCQGEEGQEFVQRFRQEAQAAARCLHPNIVTVFDFGTDQDMPFLVMELVEGEELRDVLDEPRPFSVQQSIELILPALAALGFAHEKGVVHRDIKPANIILLRDGGVKVADFGVARLDSSDLTGIGYVVGTPTYMSPEGLQARPVDGRSDLYSVGMVLLELVTGQRPHPGCLLEAGPRERIEQAGLSGDGMDRLAAVLEKSLERDAGKRYQTAAAFHNELQQWLAGAGEADRQRVAGETGGGSAAPETAAPAGMPEGQASAVTPDLLNLVEQRLAGFVGPMARRLVKQASRSAVDAGSMVAELARYIPSDTEREEFVHELEQSGVRASAVAPVAAAEGSRVSPVRAPAGFAPQPGQLEAITRELTFYLGPLAGRLVKSAAASATSLDDLCEKLAAQIPSDQDRAAFLARKSSFGPAG